MYSQNSVGIAVWPGIHSDDASRCSDLIEAQSDGNMIEKSAKSPSNVDCHVKRWRRVELGR